MRKNVDRIYASMLKQIQYKFYAETKIQHVLTLLTPPRQKDMMALRASCSDMAGVPKLFGTALEVRTAPFFSNKPFAGIFARQTTLCIRRLGHQISQSIAASTSTP